MFAPLILNELVLIHFGTFVTLHYYFVVIIIKSLLLDVVTGVDLVMRLRQSLLPGVSVVFDVESKFVGFVSGRGRRRRFQIKYMLVDFDGHGGVLRFHAAVGVHSLWLFERMCVRIVSSGIYQSVAFLRTGTLAYDVDIFGVAGTVATY